MFVLARVSPEISKMASNSDASSGKRYDYVSEPEEELKCVMCQDVAKDPLQHEACGKLLCKECLEKHGEDKPCPSCTESSRFFEDRRSLRNVQALLVKCNDPDKTCPWVGAVAAFEQHVATCEYALVSCTQCEDKTKFPKQALEEHLKENCPNRDYECEHCGEKGTYTSITKVHEEKCEKKALPCPNTDCVHVVERQGIKRHLDSCLFTEVPCKYRKLGCDVKMKRSDISEHEEQDKVHLHMALNKIVTMDEGMEKTKTSIFTKMIKVTEFVDRKISNEEFEHKFYTSPKGYMMKVSVCPNGTDNVSVCVSIRNGNFDTQLNWPFSGTVTITLLNQLEDRDHFSKTVTIRIDKHDPAKMLHDYIAHSELDYNPVKNTQYLKNDTLYFRVSGEVDNHKYWLE